jgi:hypothetical protein
MIEWRRIISVDVTCIKDIGSACKILIGKLERKKPLWELKHK